MKIDLRLGNSADVLESMEEQSIDLTVCSPPYDNLRNYQGYDFSWDTFERIARGLYKVTKDGGVVVWVVNDATINGSETLTSFKQALFFKEIGFNVHDTMIYEKTNPIPQNHNRYEQCFEFMFVFSKGRPKTFNPIKEATKNAGKMMEWGNRVTKMDDNQCRRHRESDIRVCNDYKPRKNIFSYAVGVDKGIKGHPAIFPYELARDHIISWSNEGDTVLDCFMGSGTTGVAAIEAGRNFIGIEISEEYLNLAKTRIYSNISAY